MPGIRTTVLTLVVISLAAPRPASAQAPVPIAPLPTWLPELFDDESSPSLPPVYVADVGEVNERALVDEALGALHENARKSPAFTVRFHRYDVRAGFGPPTCVEGRIHYRAPSSGVCEVEDDLCRWVYDGVAVYEFDRRLKKVREFRLAEKDFGTPVTEGPIPFLYGPDPELLRRRFSLYPIRRTDDELWIEARPRSTVEPFARVQLILKLPEHRLYAMNIIHRNGADRTAVIFDRCEVPKALGPFDSACKFGQHGQVPVGWKHEVIGGDLSLEPLKP